MKILPHGTYLLRNERNGSFLAEDGWTHLASFAKRFAALQAMDRTHFNPQLTPVLVTYVGNYRFESLVDAPEFLRTVSA